MAIGIAWGYGAAHGRINNTSMINAVRTERHKGTTFIADEGYGQTPPTQTGNVTSATCAAQTSAAPTISPAAGAYTAPSRCTLPMQGFPAASGHWATLHLLHHRRKHAHGTTSTLYTGPFSLSPGTTVKAIGMWGQGQTQDLSGRLRLRAQREW